MASSRVLSEGQQQCLRDLRSIADALGVQDRLMLIGATARMLQLDEPLGLAGRTTEDVDFVVQVNDWTQHQSLIDHALKTASHGMKVPRGQIA